MAEPEPNSRKDRKKHPAGLSFLAGPSSRQSRSNRKKDGRRRRRSGGDGDTETKIPCCRADRLIGAVLFLALLAIAITVPLIARDGKSTTPDFVPTSMPTTLPPEPTSGGPAARPSLRPNATTPAPVQE